MTRTPEPPSLAASGDGTLAALTGGYHAAFLAGEIFALAAAVIGAALLRAEMPAAAHEGEEAIGASAALEAY